MDIDIPDIEKSHRQLSGFFNPTVFHDIISRVSYTALLSMQRSMEGHNRTRLTYESLNTWLLEANEDTVTYEAGSHTRGHILRWLDRGRGEVRPKHRRMLRWYTFPEHKLVFARYARATKGIKLMDKAAADALRDAPLTASETLTANSKYTI